MPLTSKSPTTRAAPERAACAPLALPPSSADTGLYLFPFSGWSPHGPNVPVFSKLSFPASGKQLPRALALVELAEAAWWLEEKGGETSLSHGK